MGRARKPDLRGLGFQWRESVVTARAPSPYRLSVQVRKSYCVLKQPPVKDRGYFFLQKISLFLLAVADFIQTVIGHL